MLFSILWAAIPSVIPFQARIFVAHSKICLPLPKPASRTPWWEGDICLAQFSSRSPPDTQLLSRGRRVWDNQQKIDLCQLIWVTYVPQHRQASVSVETRLCSHPLSVAIFGRWRVSEDWAGLVPCVWSVPCSQAVRAGSCLAAGRDNRQKAGAVRLKHHTNRGTSYHHKQVEKSESLAYLISNLLS